MSHTLRYLRIALSATCGIAAVLLIVLWVRSYTWMYVAVRDSSNSIVEFRLNCGAVYIFYTTQSQVWPSPPAHEPTWEFSSYFASPRWQPVLAAKSVLRLPCWVAVLLTALLATVPWIRWSKSFSLRTLLIVTTLVAIALGTIVVRRQ